MIKAIPATSDNDTIKVLRDSLAQEFDSVIVLGFKEGEIYIRSSGAEDQLRLIGALEMAKYATLSADYSQEM